MTQSSWPWDEGPTPGSPRAGSQITASQWRKLANDGFGIAVPGVVIGALNELEVYGDSSGRQVKIRTGRAAARGVIFENTSEVTLAVSANGAGSTRWDVVFVKFDWANSSAGLFVRAGGTGDDLGPAMTYDETTEWDVVLGYVRVTAGATTIAASDVLPARDRWVSHQGDDPIGTIIDLAIDHTTIPKMYLACDGSTPDWHHYPKLRAVLPTWNYNGVMPWGYRDDNKTLVVPDLRGRTTVGRDAVAVRMGLKATVLGMVGGAEAVQLSIAEMPFHEHGIGAHQHSTNAQSVSHTHPVNGSGQFVASVPSSTLFLATAATPGAGQPVSLAGGSTGAQSASHTHAALAPVSQPPTGQTGGTDAHENCQPFIAVNKAIKVA